MSTEQANLVALLTALTKALSASEATPPATPSQPEITEAGGPVLISIPEAARLLGLSRASAYRYAAAGKLPVKRFGRRVYVIRARLADVVVPDSDVSLEVDAA
ncbi:helix-turn-helix domain-containing protein [Saccharopolyspora sp. K220]|uniref:helix-turn-helix domain-containing protein n=1 Tax=Saccharopolyspora soli TaxID=2926618 RepID=UPI001F57FE17|nr:helix-turn-helix domain-containing protein [Saccharopolyspora soli]MCI2420044.1 helix-turn-helix domain-containing protein [Saccharopolyspora soli]